MKQYFPAILGLFLAVGCNAPTSELSENIFPTPTPDYGAPAPGKTYSSSPVNISGVWANDGGDKVAKAELRMSKNSSVENSVWKNSKVNLFGARNEVVGFNLVLESAHSNAQSVKVKFNNLDGPGGRKIASAETSGDGVYNWTNRDIELFYIKYLKIKGVSRLGYELYDERHVPKRLRRPFGANGIGTGTWNDRPDHDQDYPDIAVPIEKFPTFNIAQGTNQSIWVDVYVPKDAAVGAYQGAVEVYEGTKLSYTIPVELKVRNFTLPDTPSSKTMLYMGYADIANRYGGTEANIRTIRDRHFQIAHRHKISMIDANNGTSTGADAPTAEWIPRLNGSLFTAANGYRGPGEGVGNGIFSVGTYGTASWQNDGTSSVQSHANNWVNWFKNNSPSTEFFLYLIDESSDYNSIQNWSNQLASNSGVGRGLASMATLPLPSAVDNTPSLNVVVSTMEVGDTNRWNNAVATHKSRNSQNKFWMYNGKRPSSGSFMVDDDGVALRENPWGAYKKGIDRWFYWESTYYNDYQGGRGQTNVFQNAQTFGATPTWDNVRGMTSGNYANGDGVLFYPGTDRVFTSDSHGLNGPIASLRLKHWRRGLQDVDYLTLASKKNPTKVQSIVNRMVKSVLWENGIADPSDPSWVRCDIGWTTNPDDWEAARAELADIIENG